MTRPRPKTDRSCPICGKTPAESVTAVRPFCSERCRNIDLGRWLGERYRVAVRHSSDEESIPVTQDNSRSGEDADAP